MEPTVQRWMSVQDFLDAAGDFLAAREAEHCLLFGLASVIAAHPEVYPGPRFWTVHEDGRVVAAALRTPPHNLVLSQVDEPRWLAALANDVLASDDIPGALGPTEAVNALAAAWSERTGRAAALARSERIFRLDRVVPPRPAPGRWRDAEERDRALLADWMTAFTAEATPDAPPIDAAEHADRALRRVGRVAYMWEDGGEAVAFGCVAGPTPRGIRIGPVYTPPDLRGRGYASNLVAAISQLQLDAGRCFCFLFTNLANPTANHIYQMIGYAPVVDVDQLQFTV